MIEPERSIERDEVARNFIERRPDLRRGRACRRAPDLPPNGCLVHLARGGDT